VTVASTWPSGSSFIAVASLSRSVACLAFSIPGSHTHRGWVTRRHYRAAREKGRVHVPGMVAGGHSYGRAATTATYLFDGLVLPVDCRHGLPHAKTRNRNWSKRPPTCAYCASLGRTALPRAQLRITSGWTNGNTTSRLLTRCNASSTPPHSNETALDLRKLFSTSWQSSNSHSIFVQQARNVPALAGALRRTGRV